MGVDTRIILPSNVRIRDVAMAFAIAAGNTIHWEKSSSNTKDSYGGDLKFLRVAYKIKTSDCSPEMAQILFEQHITRSRDTGCLAYWFWENDSNTRLIIVRSSAFWIAIAHRIVDFFGGAIDYSDCDDNEVDYYVEAKINNPTGGRAWDMFYKRMSEIEPITKEDMEHFEKFAAYSTNYAL